MLIRDLPATLAIKVNNLYVPPSTLEGNCLRFTRPALLFDEDTPEYPSMAGSATLVRHNEVNYAIVTRHQFERDEVKIEDCLSGFVIGSLQESLQNVPFEKCYFPDADGHDFSQVMALEMKDQTSSNPELFNHIRTQDLREDNRKRLFSFMVGYSNEGERILYEHNSSNGPHVVLNPIVTKCSFDPSYPNSEKFSRTYRLENSIEFGTNGCSGGSVFSVLEIDTKFELILDGIIIRGGKDIIHVIGSELLFDFL